MKFMLDNRTNRTQGVHQKSDASHTSESETKPTHGE